jgi:hypothetical protein
VPTYYAHLLCLLTMPTYYAYLLCLCALGRVPLDVLRLQRACGEGRVVELGRPKCAVSALVYSGSSECIGSRECGESSSLSVVSMMGSHLAYAVGRVGDEGIVEPTGLRAVGRRAEIVVGVHERHGRR